MAGRLHPVLTFIFAALILIFAGGPVLLSLYGSLVPDRILLSPDQSILTARAELRDLPLRLHRAAARSPTFRKAPTGR